MVDADADSDGRSDGEELEASPEPRSLKINDRGRIVSPDAVRQSGDILATELAALPSAAGPTDPNHIFKYNIYQYLHFYIIIVEASCEKVASFY